MPSSDDGDVHRATATRRRPTVAVTPSEIDRRLRRHPTRRRPGSAAAGREPHDQRRPPAAASIGRRRHRHDRRRLRADRRHLETTPSHAPTIDEQLPPGIEVGEVGEPAPVAHSQPAAADRLDGDRLGEGRQLGEQRVRLAVGRHQPVAHEVAVVLGLPEVAAVGDPRRAVRPRGGAGRDRPTPRRTRPGAPRRRRTPPSSRRGRRPGPSRGCTRTGSAGGDHRRPATTGRCARPRRTSGTPRRTPGWRRRGRG